MMNPVQNKACELLIELRDICDKNSIDYYLCGHTAVEAYGLGYLDTDLSIAQIAIWPKDALRLVKAIEKENNPNRAIDYLGNNPDFPGLFMKYFATDTTQFEIHYLHGYQHYGMSVNIHFIFYSPADRVLNKKLNILNLGLTHRIDREEFLTKEELYAVEVFGKWRKKRFWMNSKAIFKYFMKEYGKPSEEVLLTAKVKPRFNYKLPASVMTGKSTVMIEDHEFTLPLKQEEYIKSIYKRDYRIVLKERQRYPRMVTNDTVPYEEYFRELGETPVQVITRMQKKDTKVRERNIIISEKNAYIKRAFNVASIVNELLVLDKMYNDEYIETMKQYYEHGDIEAFISMADHYLEFRKEVTERDLVPHENPIFQKLEGIFKELNLI